MPLAPISTDAPWWFWAGLLLILAIYFVGLNWDNSSNAKSPLPSKSIQHSGYWMIAVLFSVIFIGYTSMGLLFMFQWFQGGLPEGRGEALLLYILFGVFFGFFLIAILASSPKE